MTDQCGENHGALTTAPIFDDAVYLSEALDLPVNQNEEDVDAELALLARESGIQDPYRYLPPRDISRALSTVTLDSDHRSSMSIHSQETQSTGFTSAPSRTSRDQMCAQKMPLKAARLAASNDGSSTASSGTSQVTDQEDTTSTKPSPPSVILSPSSVTSPRRKRGSLFGMFRRDSNSCTSRSHHTPQGRGRGPKLECGHALSEYAIRVHIQEAIEKGGNAVPSCCGHPIPRETLEQVLAKEEADLVTHTQSQQPIPEASSSRDSGYCEKVGSAIELGSTAKTPTLSATSTSLPDLPSRRRHEAISLDSALAREAFKSFRTPQKAQFERVAAFEASQRKALLAHHQSSLMQLAVKHESDRNCKLKQHVQDLEHLEEVQIIAEHDLRKAHDLETQNVALALKHMKAYCLRDNASHPDDAHVVTEEDFRKLDRQRAMQEGLPRKHENAINVLRARQERETKNRLLKQQTEIALLDEDYERKKAAEEADYAKELEKLEALIGERRKRLMQRWELKFEIWRHDWEEQHGTTLNGRLDHESWPLPSTYAMMPVPESSSLAPFVKTLA